MKTTEQTIPGLPPLDRRRELRAQLEIAKKDAKDAQKEMRAAAIELAELVAARWATSPDAVPPEFTPATCAFRNARANNLNAEAEAGRIADELVREISRMEGAAK